MSNLEYRKSVIQINNDEYYWGQWVIGEDLRSGRGVFVNSKKEIYEGFWYNNYMHGRGRHICKYFSLFPTTLN